MLRKNIRLPRVQYFGREKYFITLCCAKRRRIFAAREPAERAISLLFETAQKHSFAVHAYCLMPDHLHALVEGLSAESRLLPFVMDYKRKTTVSLAMPTGSVLWQKKFYDHILRQKDSPDGIVAYILMNPVRAGVCDAPGNYPFSGSSMPDWRNRLREQEPWVPSWRKPV